MLLTESLNFMSSILGLSTTNTTTINVAAVILIEILEFDSFIAVLVQQQLFCLVLLVVELQVMILLHATDLLLVFHTKSYNVE